MTWNISTIVAEVFYCIIGLNFIATGMKALKDDTCVKKGTTALFWFILAFTFIMGPYLPKWITGLCVVFLAILTAFKRVAPSKSDIPKRQKPVLLLTDLATAYLSRRWYWLSALF